MSEYAWQLKRGAAEFRLGRPFPPRPYDESGNTITDDELICARWYGYMLERGKYLIACSRVRDALNDFDPDDPRPPLAMAA